MENREFVGVDAWGFGGKCWRICVRLSRFAKVIGTQSFDRGCCRENLYFINSLKIIL